MFWEGGRMPGMRAVKQAPYPKPGSPPPCPFSAAVSLDLASVQCPDLWDSFCMSGFACWTRQFQFLMHWKFTPCRGHVFFQTLERSTGADGSWHCLLCDINSGSGGDILHTKGTDQPWQPPGPQLIIETDEHSNIQIQSMHISCHSPQSFTSWLLF